MDYLTASEMKYFTDDSIKASNINLITEDFINKIYKEMIDSADNHKYKLNVDVTYKSKDIYLDQSDCDAIATNLMDFFGERDYSLNKFSVGMNHEDSTFDKTYVYRVLGTISWENA